MKKSQLLNLFLLSAVAVGCTDSQIDDSISNATTSKREVVVGVGTGSKMSVTPEESLWDIEWETTDHVVGWTALGEKADFNVNEIYDDGRADIKGTITDASETMRFFYPYDAAFDGTVDLSAQSFDFDADGYNALDLYMLSDAFTIPEEGDVTTTTMRHIFSFLKLNITPSNTNGETYVVNKAVIKGLNGNKVVIGYDYDSAATPLAPSETGDITLTIANAEALADGETLTIPFSIIPFTATGEESLTVELYFDDKFIGKSVAVGAIIAESLFERGKYNDFNVQFDFATATDIDTTTSYALSAFDGTLTPEGDTWFISDENSDSSLNVADFDGLKAAIAEADNDNLEVVFLNLKNLPDRAFDAEDTTTNNYQLNKFKVNLPEVGSISASAFHYCHGLTYISAPKATVIYEDGLRRCKNLAGFNLPNIEELQGLALQLVPVEEFNFPKVTKLSGASIFNACPNITSITLGNGDDCIGVSEIFQTALGNITGGTTGITLTIREGVNSSASYTIDGNTLSSGDWNYEFTSIIVDEMEYDVDENVYMLADINATVYPGGVEWSIGDAAATVSYETEPPSDSQDYTQNDFNGLIAAIEAANAKNIKPNLIFTELLEMPAFAFYFKKNLEFSLTFKKATTIGKSAFYDCEKISSISGAVVNTIGASAFRQCYAVTSIDLPELKTTGGNVFRKLTSLKSVSLPKLTTVGSDEFNISTALESVELASLPAVGHGMFEGCTALKSVKLPSASSFLAANNLSDAFKGCTAIETIDLGTESSGVSSVLSGTFESSLVENGDYVGCALNIRVASSSNIAVDGNTLKIFADATVDKSTATPTATVTFQSIVVKELVIPDDYSCTLADFDGTYSLETMGKTWTITDAGSSAVTTDFDNLELAIAAANGQGTYPKLIFKNLELIPDSAFWTSGEDGINNDLQFSVELTAATVIGSDAFRRCNKITSFTADKVTTMRYVAGGRPLGNIGFSSTDLTSISLPELTNAVIVNNKGVVVEGVVLGGQTFRAAPYVESISIPKVTGLGSNEFNGCTALKTLTIGSAGYEVTVLTATSGKSDSDTFLNAPTTNIDLTIAVPADMNSANYTIDKNVLTINDAITVSYTFKSINGNSGE